MRSAYLNAILASAALAIAAPAFAAPGLDDLLAHADANHDGRVTRAEFAAERDKMFERLDRRHQGYISADSVRRPKARRAAEALVASADANHDGRVTRAEFDASPMRAFDAADTNHDGVVDRRELEAAAARRS